MTMNNHVDPDNPNHTVVRNRSPRRIDNQPGLHPSTMTDEQLTMVADTWQLVKDTDTPVGNLRTAMSDSGLFDFSDSQTTNNLELHTIALTAQDTLELRNGSTRADEIRAIVGVTEGKSSADEMRTALNDLLGEHVVDDMSDDEIARFVRDARTALSFLDTTTASDTSGDTNDTAQQSVSNRELADQVSDLLDGQLVVNDTTDRVQYGAGATAGGQKVGGQFASKSQLQAIAAHADEIRDGLADRGSPDDDETATTAGTVDVDTTTSDSADTDTDAAASTGDVDPSTVAAGHDTPSTDPATPDVDTDTTTPDNPTTSTPEAQGPLVLSFIDETHDAIAAARDAAEARLRNELAQGGRVKRFFRNMWKGENGLAGVYYLEKYKREALAQIEQENDVLALESSDAEARTRAQVATIERFQSEYDESIHDEAGERREKIADDSEFALAMKDLIRRYASGEITDPEALRAEQGRALERLAENGQMNLIGEGKVRLDNLLAIAEQVKAMADNEDSINRMLDGMKLYNAEARTNARTENELSRTEKLLDRLQRSGQGLGGLVGPETLSVAAAVALGVARVGRGSLIRAAGVTLAPGVLGGAFAAVRESKRVKQERTLHAREMAQGKEYATGKRRDALNDTLYETESAQDLTAQLESLLVEGQDYTPEQIQGAYEAIAQIEARIRLSDKRDIDLVAYSDVLEIPKERRDLDTARALAKVRLAGRMGDLPDDFRTRFNITDGQPVNEALGRYTDAIVELDKDIDAKDKAFRKLRLRRVAVAAGVGFGTSLVIGLGAQEALAFVSPSYDGLAEHLVHGGSPSEDGRQTLLEGMFNGSGAHTEHITSSTTYDSYAMGTHQNALELPSNYHVVTASNGTMTIEGPKGFTPIEGLTLEKNGSLSPESLQLLKDHNISVADTGVMVQGKDQIITQNMSVEQYNTLHSGDTVHVTRDFPYDNNTSVPDRNEQKLWWAGEGDKGVGKDGTIKMSISHMTEGGSSHDGHHASWSQAAHDNKLKLAVSASRDTQAHVYFVEVKPDGTIDIPKDNPASKFFSVDKDGQAQFNGAYAEVVEVRSEAGGVTHIAPLATETGSNSLTEIPEKISKPTQVYVPHVKLTPPAITHELQGRTVEGFGMPGFVPRRPLEQIRREARGGYGYNYNYGYNQEGGFEEKWRQERSPRLKRDPDADLTTGQELSWYQKEQEKKRGKDYISEINQYIEQSKPLSELGDETKAIVCIPVAAANEADNIYRTLSMFGRQDVESQKSSMILLNVNWKKSLEGDPAQMANIQKTKDEIERARRDFPDLRIASFDKVWSDEFVAEKNGKIYGEVIKVLYDAAAFAMDKAVKEGRRDASTEAVLITNDADTEGMSSKYLKNYIRALEQNPKQDAFTGIIRRGVSSYKDYPGYGFVSNFYANTTMAMIHHQQRGGGGFSTDGPNSGIRMSMYAAMGGVEDEVGAGADGMLTHRMSTVRRSEGDRTLWHKIRRTDAPKGSERVMGKLVAGSSLDTLPDRLLGAYRQGKWIASGWDGFDNGGYESREAVAAAGTVGPENPATEIDAIATRIETSIQAFGSRWWRNPSVIATSLRTTFGPNKPGEELYEYQWDLSKPGDGAFTFHFTDRGKEELKKRMLFDRKGNASEFGERMRHHLYDKLKSDKEPTLLS